jgi:hypothetical protein
LGLGIWGGWIWEGGGVDDRGRRGGGFGFEFFEGLEGAVIGAAGGIHAVLEFGEGRRVARGGLSERVFLFVGVAVLGGVLPHLGFGGAVAAEKPFAVDNFIEVEAGFGGIGLVAVVVVVDELLEIGEFLGGEDEGFGVNAGFEGIHGGGGLACDRGGAGGFLRVTAVGFYLTLGRHMGNSGTGTGKDACPTLRINNEISGIGGECL